MTIPALDICLIITFAVTPFFVYKYIFILITFNHIASKLRLALAYKKSKSSAVC